MSPTDGTVSNESAINKALEPETDKEPNSSFNQQEAVNLPFNESRWRPALTPIKHTHQQHTHRGETHVDTS